MNGQDKSLARSISNRGSLDRASAAAGFGSAGGGNVAPTGAVASESWLKEMMNADALRAAQAGRPVRPTDNPAAVAINPVSSALGSFPPEFMSQLAMYGGIPHQLAGFYPGLLQSMQPPATAAATSDHSSAANLPTNLSGMKGGSYNHSSSAIATATESSSMLAKSPHGHRYTPNAPSAATGIGPSNPMPHYRSHRPTTAASASQEPPKKRSKADTKMQPPPTDHMSPSGSTSADSMPHRPSYFHKGSVIQLAGDQLKRIEDLETHDFEVSAHHSPDLCLDCSTVKNIKKDESKGTVYLTFSVGDHTHDQVDATVEATLEHPFFVFSQGWSSVSPEKTLGYYNLPCRQLQVNDKCISLTFKDGAANASSQSFTDGGHGASSKLQK